MKPITKKRTPGRTEQLRQYKAENFARSLKNPNENWLAALLAETAWQFNRQCLMGDRIFDFWSKELGVAIESDGKGHDPEWDYQRDEWNFRRSAIVVLRVRNRNLADASKAIALLPRLGTFSERRGFLFKKEAKASLMRFTALPDRPSLLECYLTGISSGLSSSAACSRMLALYEPQTSLF